MQYQRYHNLQIIINMPTFDILYQSVWDSTKILDKIQSEHKEEELMNLLENEFQKPIDITFLNDFLRSDYEYIYEQLGIEIED